MQQQTSLLAYEEVQPNIGTRQAAIMKALREMGEATNNMIAGYLIWPINCVTPRVYELRHKGLIVESRRGICSVTRRMAIFWRIKPVVTLKYSPVEIGVKNAF